MRQALYLHQLRYGSSQMRIALDRLLALAAGTPIVSQELSPTPIDAIPQALTGRFRPLYSRGPAGQHGQKGGKSSSDGAARRAERSRSIMYAVVKTGGKQYRVAKDDVIRVERLSGDVGGTIELADVLMIGDGDKTTVGAPMMADAKVVAEVVEQTRDAKALIFKKKRRKHHRRLRGHRQEITVLRITDILPDGIPVKKRSSKAAMPPPEETAKEVVAEPQETAAPEPAAKAKPAAKKPAAKKATTKKPAAKKPAAKKSSPKKSAGDKDAGGKG